MDEVLIPIPPESARDGVGASRARRVNLAIDGMSSALCASRVERALSASEGVLSVSVDLATERARVSLGRDRAEDDAALASRLQGAVEAAGFAASMIKPPSAESNEAGQRDTRELILACVLTAPLIVSMLLHLLFVLLHQDGLAVRLELPGWVQFLLATPVQFWLGRPVYRSAMAGLRRGTCVVELLAALGATVAWVVSTAALLSGSHAWYFGIAALTITSLLIGGWLDRQRRRRAAEPIRSLLDMLPETVIRRASSSLAEQDTPRADLRVGDLLMVRPGARVAVDGVVRDGKGQVDESLLPATGSRVVLKARGEPVTAGSLALEGSLLVEALAVGADTRLAKALRILEGAPIARAPRLADQVCAFFAPVVLVFALLTLVGWWAASGNGVEAIWCAVSVLVIACPCALGLASPAALAAGSKAAAGAGIVFRDAGAIERARGIGIAAFDKTGTLTEARAAIEQVVPAGGASHYAEAAELLTLSASMQDASDHPLAAAVRASSGHAVMGAAVRAHVVPGYGVTARVGGQSLLLGSRRMIEGEGWRLPAGLAETAERVDAQGGTVALLAERRAGAAGGSRILGLLGFTDVVAPRAAEAMARLSRRGITTILLTADGEGAARRVAGDAGVDRLLSGLPPEDKADAVRRLAREAQGAEQPRLVAMAGSDAPALAAADLGIATGIGSDAALDAASIVVLRRDPDLIVDAVEVAALTSTHVREGLFWAFVFNGIGMPIAAAGLLSPALAAGAATLGCVGVVINALRLRSWRPDEPQQTLMPSEPA